MSFDAIARGYRFVEALVFGPALQRARVAWLGEVTTVRQALVVGEGDGRFLEQLLRVAPDVRVECVDASARMLELATARVPSDRVTWVQADLATYVPHQRYDLVVTHFVLDCLDGATLPVLVARLAGALEPGGRWLLADFRVPKGRLRSLRAHFWLFMMYAFFRLVAGLRVRALVDPTPSLETSGLVRQCFVETDAGFLGSAVWRQPSAC